MPAAVRRLAGQLQALGHPTRLALVAELLSGPKSVGGLAATVGVSFDRASHHMRTLRDAGLVAGTRRGQRIEYALAPGVRVDDVLMLAGGWAVRVRR